MIAVGAPIYDGVHRRRRVCRCECVYSSSARPADGHPTTKVSNTTPVLQRFIITPSVIRRGYQKIRRNEGRLVARSGSSGRLRPTTESSQHGTLTSLRRSARQTQLWRRKAPSTKLQIRSPGRGQATGFANSAHRGEQCASLQVLIGGHYPQMAQHANLPAVIRHGGRQPADINAPDHGASIF